MKMKRTGLILAFASLLALVPSLRGQAVYTASRSTSIQAGAGLLYLSPDYTNESIKGLSVWADYDFHKYLGVEVSYHDGSIITPADIAENSYMIGPRFLYRKRRFTGAAKFLFGRASIINQQYNLSTAYNAYAFGATLEYRLKRKINIRVIDIESQKWPDFEPHTLTPLAITVGASYVIF